MEKKTASEIIALLEANFGKLDVIYGDIINDDVEKHIGGTVNVVAQHCEGDTIYCVLHFIDHDVFIRLNGYYSSEDGTDPQDYEEVIQREITTTVYDSSIDDDEESSSEEEEESSSSEEENETEEDETDENK